MDTSLQKIKRSIRLLNLSIQYFNVVELLLTELIKNRNRAVAFAYQDTEENLFDLYRETTKFSDFRIVEPLLFNLFHAFELFLKGLLLTKEGGNLNHSLSNLLNDFTICYEEKKDLIKILKLYIGENEEIVNPIKDFLEDNNVTIDNFYEVLKYPFDKKGKKDFTHRELKYKIQKGLQFYKNLFKNIGVIKLEIKEFKRELRKEL